MASKIGGPNDPSHIAKDGYGKLSAQQAFSRFAGRIGAYAFGNALQRVGAFVLLPLYLSYLSPEEYGLLALTSLLPVVIPPLFSLGLPNAIERYYPDWHNEGIVSGNLGVIWLIVTGASLVLTLVLDHFGRILLTTFLTQVPFDPYLRWGIWWSFFSGLVTCPLFLLRIKEQSWGFVGASLLSFSLGIGLTLWAVVSGRGVIGILQMQTVSAAVVALVLSRWYWTQAAITLHPAAIAKACRFALPLVPSALLEIFATRADRFFLDKWVALPEIGFYALANQVGQVVKFFYDSVKPAWFPFYIRVARERSDASIFLGRIATLYVAALGAVAITVFLMAPTLLMWLSRNAAYSSALPLIPILVVAYFFQGLAPLGTAAVLVAERTLWQPPLQLVQVLAVIGANLALTQHFGTKGAAWSLVITYGVLATMYLTIGQQVHPLIIERARIAMVLSFVAIASIVLMLWPGEISAVSRLVLSLVLNSGILATVLWGRNGWRKSYQVS